MKPYFLHDGTVQSGPFSMEELEQKKILPDTLVWKAGMPDWVIAHNMDELKSLFETQPAQPPVFKQKPNIPNTPKEEVSTPNIPNKEIENTKENSRKKFLLIGGIIILLAGIGLFWFFKSRPEKEIVTPPVIAMARDSVIENEPVKKDTAHEVSMDSIASLLNFDSTKSNPKKTDTTTTQGGFTMGGMSTGKEKTVPTDKSTKKEKEKKTGTNPEQNIKQNEKPERDETRKPTVSIKSLIISGTFHKNILLESVMEGSIRNPNDRVSFQNIMVTATFLNADGEQTGSRQFHQNGTLPAGGNTSFKFKTNAPKGSKSARFSVSASPIN